MFGFIFNGIGGVAVIAAGMPLTGCVMLAFAGLWLMLRNVGNDD